MRKKKIFVVKNKDEKSDELNKKQQIGKDINRILDRLSPEELTELENMGEFSKEAIEWIRERKKRKKFRAKQEAFEQSLRMNQAVIQRTELVGKMFGMKNGEYKAKNRAEQVKLDVLAQDIEREERIKDFERIYEKEKTKDLNDRIL